jgi:hypothetical protein
MQAASDIFLGWQAITEADGTRTDYYLRQRGVTDPYSLVCTNLWPVSSQASSFTR